MPKVIITGGAGFIGSVLVGYLNKQGMQDIIIVDHLNHTEKWKNLVGKKYITYLDRQEFLENKNQYIAKDDIVVHLWACSSTTEKDANYLMYNNSKYSYALYEQCIAVGAKFIYASSAATYGDGSLGYDDITQDLKPLNMYGYSKHLFDQRMIRETDNFTKNTIPVVGLKFFNVYGPNEYHKDGMRSVVYTAFHTMLEKGEISLFKSYKPEFPDGGQQRDFVYVMDVIKVIYFFMTHVISGIFNVGTGTARSFYDLAVGVCSAMHKEKNIHFVDMPEVLQWKYQYFTQANMEKLKSVGYTESFYSLEDGIKDYVQEYLAKESLIY